MSNKNKKILVSLILGAFMYIGFGNFLVTYAAGQADIEATRTSVLPSTDNSYSTCVGNLSTYKSSEAIGELNSGGKKRNDILGCAIKTGMIKLYMVPYFIQVILEFIIGISGIVSVAAIVYGGYWYLFAGISEDKDKGKKAIQNGLLGMVLALTAWTIVNIVIGLLTM